MNSQCEDLNIFHINIRSIRKNFDYLVVFIESLKIKFHIIALSEVWINAYEINKYSLPGYDTVIQERARDASGGVLIYISNDLKYDYLNLSYLEAEGILLELFVPLTHNNNYKLSLICMYRNYRYSFTQFRTNFYSIISSIKGPLIFLGDMNLCILEQNRVSMDYLSIFSSLGLDSCINTPTRGNRCLDHVFIRPCKYISFRTDLVITDLTDHYGAIVACKFPMKVLPKMGYYKAVDFSLLSRRLSDANWSSVYESQCVNSSLVNFYSVYNECVEQSSFLKLKNTSTVKRKPWISDFLVKKINQKNKVFKMCKRSQNNLDLIALYQQLSRECSFLVKREKRNYFSKLIQNCNGDSRSYWNVVKSILRKEVKMSKQFVINGNILEVDNNEKVVADGFNVHFTGIQQQLLSQEFGSDLYNLPPMTRANCNFTFDEITSNDIVRTVNKMNNKRSVGTDGISIITIKQNILVFTPLIKHMFNLSFQSGIYPESLKTSLVVPIHKSDDVKELNNYRPISLQNSLSKILENLVKDKIMQFFNTNNLLSENQFGFSKNKNTDLVVERHITNIVHNIDDRKPTIGVYLDFTKAFDLVSHDILLYKLSMYGISETVIKWFESFLKGRKQVVRINNVLSDMLEVNYGVPQGGVLGPILFVIYINDLLQINLNSSIYSFADDTSLVCSANSFDILHSKINKDLDCISKWMRSNKLLINTKKSKAVIFSYKPQTVLDAKSKIELKCHAHSCIYNCNCNQIEIVRSVKYLGLYIDEELCWRTHVDFLRKKLRKISYNLYHMRDHLSPLDLRTVYISWFESTLRYGIIIWGGTYATILKPIVVAQKLAIRTVCNTGKYESSAPLFKFLNIMNYSQIYRYSLLLFVKKHIELFTTVIISRTTRNANERCLVLPNWFKSTSRNQCYYKCIVLYNNYIDLVCLDDSLGVFKKKLREYIKDE